MNAVHILYNRIVVTIKDNRSSPIFIFTLHYNVVRKHYKIFESWTQEIIRNNIYQRTYETLKIHRNIIPTNAFVIIGWNYSLARNTSLRYPEHSAYKTEHCMVRGFIQFIRFIRFIRAFWHLPTNRRVVRYTRSYQVVHCSYNFMKKYGRHFGSWKVYFKFDCWSLNRVYQHKFVTIRWAEVILYEFT